MKAIIVADKHEIMQLPFEVKTTRILRQFKFTIFTNDVIFVHAGIGLVNAAAATQALLDLFDISEIWNYGAVGASNQLAYQDLVAPAKIYFHDVVTPWYPLGQTPGEAQYFKNALSLPRQNNLASGSSFLDQKNQIKSLKKILNVDIFDMECAAIAQIAFKNQVPFKVIKCVSDIIGETINYRTSINERITVAGRLALAKVLELIEL